ncbi:tetratricopeptide repeat protein [bacterium]|nr:tetratricopeptide repeat protein [bacterium]
MKKLLRRIWTKIYRIENFTRDYREKTIVTEIPLIAYANWGKYLTDIQDWDSAIEKLETAILMYSSNPLPYTNLGILFAKRKEYGKAKEMFEKSLKLDSNNQTVYSMLGGVLVEMGQYSEAEEILKSAQKLGSGNTDIYINYAVALAKQKKFQKAIAQMQKCKQKDPTNINCCFLLALFYLDTGRTQEALVELKYVKYMKDDYRQVDYYMGVCLAKLKDYKNAYNYGLKELERDKNNPALYILLAECAQRLGNTEASNNLYQESVNKGYSSDKLYYSWGCSLFNAGQTEEAKEKFLMALRLNGENLDTMHKLAQCFLRTKDYSSAEEFCRKAISAQHDYVEAYSDLGFIKYKQGQYKEALENFDKATKFSRRCNFLYFYIANCYYKTGNIKESLNFYAKTIEYYPNHLEAYINYVTILLSEGDTKEALRKVRTAYKLNRDNPKLIYLYALTLFRTGLYYDTIEKVEELLLKEPDSLKGKYLKIDSLIKINKVQNALGLLREIPESEHESAVYLYLNYLAYFSLAQENPTNYNKSTTLYYCDKMKELYPDEEDWEKTKNYITGTLKTEEE